MRRRRVALCKMRRYGDAPTEWRRKAALRAVPKCSLWASSHERLETVLSLVEFAPPEIFWPALMEEWPSCDATWKARNWLLRAIETGDTLIARAFFTQEQYTRVGAFDYCLIGAGRRKQQNGAD
jgi:hypothetical protein